MFLKKRPPAMQMCHTHTIPVDRQNKVMFSECFHTNTQCHTVSACTNGHLYTNGQRQAQQGSHALVLVCTQAHTAIFHRHGNIPTPSSRLG